MRRVSVTDVPFVYDAEDPAGYRAGMARLGPDLGAVATGTTAYELPPGEALCPYHYEHGEEEWLLVLAGRPTLRHPDGVDQLDEWDLVFFPTGPEGAHRVQNDTDGTVRVLMYSSVVYPTVTVYPDSDKIGVWTTGEDDDLMVRRASGVPYYDGETGEG